MADPDAYTKPFQLVKTMRRTPYPAIDPTKPELSQKGKVVIVTGAAGGIGYRTVESFAQAGAAGIVLVGRNEKTLEDAAKIAKGVPTLIVPTDLSNVKAVETLFAKVKERFGKVDVLAHVAGVGTENLTVVDSDPDAWWREIDINIRGTHLVNHFFAKTSGGQGTIINLTSGAAALAAPGLSAYGIGKWAQIRITEILQQEKPDLRVFALHPGVVYKEEGRGMLVDSFTPFAKDDPKLAADFMVYLASPKADFLKGGYVGANWDVDELELHKDEIVQKQLTRTGFLKAQLGPEGHPWES